MADGAAFNGSARSGPGNAPRRLSYATVASGSALQLDPNIRMTDAYSSSHNPSSQGSFVSPNSSTPRPANRPTGSAADAVSQGLTQYCEKPTTLPAYSRKFANMQWANNGVDTDAFLVPSYLQQSRYAARLRAAYTAREKKLREHVPTNTAQLSQSSAGGRGLRIAPSHRGMTYEVIESVQPREEEHPLTPLPSKWNSQDMHAGLDILNEGVGLKYSGTPSKSDVEAAAARTDYPVPPACGVFYYEVEIKNRPKDGAFAIGFAAQNVSLERQPGWETDSWAYHGDDGKTFSGDHQGKSYGPTFTTGDTVGCGIDFSSRQAFFTRNGVDLDVAFKQLPNLRVFPCVGMKKWAGGHVVVNFGQRPFLYDIDTRVAEDHKDMKDDVIKTKFASLHPGLDTTSFTQRLVAQFLCHGGYTETAQAFQEECGAQRESLSTRTNALPQVMEMNVLEGAQRQQIRQAILRGDLDLALEVTEQHFPEALRRAPQMLFRLKCRKWVELQAKAAGLAGQKRSSNGIGKSAQVSADVTSEQAMELDDNENLQTPPITSETETPDYDLLVAQALEYGQALMKEYRGVDEEHRRTLDEIFSLMAYNDPRQSVHGYLLNPAGRSKVADELNETILESLGQSPEAAIEVTFRNTESLIDTLGQGGSSASLLNLRALLGIQELESRE